MQWYEAEVRDLVARLAAKPVPDPVVVYGSSSVRLWTTMAGDLGNACIVNAGFGGSTLEACAYFFARIIAPVKPTALMVYAGDNDLGDGRTPEHVLESFLRLAAQVQVDRASGPIPFGFMSIKPSPARAHILDRIRRTNDLIRTEIERYPNGFYVPLFDAMMRDGQPCSDLYLEDGLHLGPAGYALWTRSLEPYRDRFFAPHSDTCRVRAPVHASAREP